MLSLPGRYSIQPLRSQDVIVTSLPPTQTRPPFLSGSAQNASSIFSTESRGCFRLPLVDEHGRFTDADGGNDAQGHPGEDASSAGRDVNHVPGDQSNRNRESDNLFQHCYSLLPLRGANYL